MKHQVDFEKGRRIAMTGSAKHEVAMTRKKKTDSEFGQALRTIALQYPEVEEGIACQGTTLESSNFKAGKKSFLFIGPADVKVKLRESQAEAARLAAKEPGRCRVGANGWVSICFSSGDFPPLDLLERWIDESYRVVAGKKLVAMLPERGVLARTMKKKRS